MPIEAPRINFNPNRLNEMRSMPLYSNIPSPMGRVQSDEVNEFGFRKGKLYKQGETQAAKHAAQKSPDAGIDEYTTNSFVQLLARDGNVSQVASLSYNLSGDVNSIRSVLKSIYKGQVSEKTYGEDEDQITFFIEEDLDIDQTLEDFIMGPVAAYKGIKGLEGQERIQRNRKKDLLGHPHGKGRLFKDIFYGKVDHLVPAYLGDGTADFCWNYEVEGDMLVGLDPDGNRQNVDELADDIRVDPEMRRNLKDMQEFMAKTPKGKKRFMLKANADKTVKPCCGNSVSASLSSKDVYQEQHALRIQGYQPTDLQKSLGALGSEDENRYCKHCSSYKVENKCKCNDKSRESN